MSGAGDHGPAACLQAAKSTQSKGCIHFDLETVTIDPQIKAAVQIDEACNRQLTTDHHIEAVCSQCLTLNAANIAVLGIDIEHLNGLRRAGGIQQ